MIIHRSKLIAGDRKERRSAPHAGARTVRGSARCSRRWLRDEQDLAGRLAALQGLVRFPRLSEGELVLDPQLDLAVTDPPEQLLGALEQLLARGDVVVEARPLEEEGAAHVELLEIEGRNRSARRPEEEHEAARAETVGTPFGGGWPHPGLHHLY